LKNLTIKILLFFLRPFFKKGGKDQILIVATTALGDTLWSTPAISALRKQFPNAHLSVFTSPIGLEILKHNPNIDQFYSIKKPFALLKRRFETIFIFHTSQRFVLPLCSLLSDKIVGTMGIHKGLDPLLTHPMPQENVHEITRRLNLIQAPAAVETLSFHLTKEEMLPPRSKGPWIALHPGSKDAFKRWPYFADLGNLLKKNFPSCEILITGSKDEETLMQEIAHQIPEAHLDTPNRPLREFAALLNQMDLIITNDTGPLHLACALNRPVIGIYASTDPSLCGPHQAKNARIISRKPSCKPCLKRKCREPFCFLQIHPEEVLLAVRELL
jgi:ADP-heptose:LPS heptosyltransferase